jgi:circadian clock protein KaiC
MNATTHVLPRAATGVAGLDDVFDGGLARDRLHLLEGSPGTGKTTIALQFLLAGAQAGEVGIYVSLAETENELRDGVNSHGWAIGDNLVICELVPPESVLDPTITRACSIPRTSNLAKPCSEFSMPSSDSSPCVW